MYRGILDSGWVQIEPLTVLVGKNESGKTSLLKALHKFNPFGDEPFSIEAEWPRGHRQERRDDLPVCTVRFSLTPEESAEFAEKTGEQCRSEYVDITRDYAGRLETIFPGSNLSGKVHPHPVEDVCRSLPQLTQPIGAPFAQKANEFLSELRRLVAEGRYSQLEALHSRHVTELGNPTIRLNQNPQQQNEQQFFSSYSVLLGQVAAKTKEFASPRLTAHDFVVSRLPTFIYMSDYRSFEGAALLDQVQQRKQQNTLTEVDNTFLTILDLSGLELASLVSQGNAPNQKELRQYDLDDGAATLTQMIADRWKQRKYEVQFRADGQFFFTFVKDALDRALIRLEERSKGFQWFFSFDLLFMHETQGTFKDSVILLDEPGLHLHPDAQKDLLVRLADYAAGNTLIYSTHLPFMIDLRHPERIRALSESDHGIVVSDNLYEAQPEGRFTVQAALGMSWASAHLGSPRNLVVEGVEDYWYLTSLSNLLARSELEHLPEDLYVTAAWGASEAAYLATFMVGQKLDVVALFDTDKAGDDARNKLIKSWVARYRESRIAALSLGEIAESPKSEFLIEDIFPDDFYLSIIQDVYERQLRAPGPNNLKLVGSGPLVKRVERAMEGLDIKFNKGSVAKVLKARLDRMKTAEELPKLTRETAIKIMRGIAVALDALESRAAGN